MVNYVKCKNGHLYSPAFTQCPYCPRPVHFRASRDLVGQHVASFKIEDLIAEGGAASVWLAQDLRLGRKLALKLYDTTHTSNVAVERFSREAMLLSRVSHPSIVTVYDVGRWEKYLFIAMEYVDGVDLGAIIGWGRVRLSWAVRVSLEIAKALQYAHEADLIHRDVKPGNILVESASDRSKLADFGLARGLPTLPTITSVAAPMGTPQYMAPEQFAGCEAGPWTDIYCLGATLYHLCTNVTARPASEVTTIGDWVKQSRLAESGTPTPIQELRSDIPAALSSHIGDMLSPAIEDRPDSLHPLIDLLSLLSRELTSVGGSTLHDRAIEVSFTANVDEPDQSPGSQAVPNGMRSAPPNSEHKEVQPAHHPPASAGGLTVMAVKPSKGFFEQAVFPKTQFFRDDVDRYDRIRETLEFYRTHLNCEYVSLLRQASTTHRLWLLCVVTGFLVLLSGIVAVLLDRVQQGVITVVSSTIVYFIQKLFQQREDYYREQAASKNSHLVYGNQWLLVIQSIDSITDQDEKTRRQARLVEVLTDKLLS